LYDYLEKQNYKEQERLEPYINAHSGIYRQIEEKLKKGKFSYARFLSLPLHFDLPQEYFQHTNPETKYKILLTEILDLCSVPLFEHICRCLYRYQDRFREVNEGFFLIST